MLTSAIVFPQPPETIAQERGVPLSVIVQDNISLRRPACLQRPKPVLLTHRKGMKSEECTWNLHPFLSLQRNIDEGLFMEPYQDLQASNLSVFNVCLCHLILSSFSCFCVQIVHSGRIHNALKLKTFHRVVVGQAGAPEKGASEGEGYKHYTTE